MIACHSFPCRWTRCLYPDGSAIDDPWSQWGHYNYKKMVQVQAVQMQVVPVFIFYSALHMSVLATDSDTPSLVKQDSHVFIL